MCCFAGPVRSVDSTRIFARLTDRGTQWIAYQMRYDSAEPNAMILPLPVRMSSQVRQNDPESAIRFVDLSGYEDLFADLDRGFPRLESPAEDSLSVESIPLPMANIEVHSVGSFDASFVPSIDQFERLDPRFVIPEKTWAAIPEYQDYSFAVFQLKELRGEAHPMAFEFQTRLPDTLFFPTVHIHDGEVHEVEEFDHSLYGQHPNLDAAAGDYTDKTVEATGMVRSNRPAAAFVDVKKSQAMVDGNLLVHRRKLGGRLPNQDTWVSTQPPQRPTVGTFGWTFRGSAALAAMSAATTWIVRRRQTISQKT
ncbi:hypothetical protein [Neorhodopirellula pilleata]|uniref:DUF2330 domain-containing protein n=1 Tax=Neorhodopirellula pilleata TaxID=2714738 RepID=A0A5C6B0V3_9BACT|nr:hypothetical protein [Neorhodopirellula pilleata]TWU04014.1 hypothetical protein Pla100_09500 [Neorhodopirellula pilleata]